ncbi:hypothetical protein [Granulicella aggregans]|uniref:hypothetical protein n=1 Tax=Granulicella aggregans TaxID=474949 RepID=UPI0021DFC57F|nr:hypothetical protein [Granulicella aggregans]
MPHLLTKLSASFILFAAVAAQAQIRIGAPKKSSADVGVNSVNAPVPTPLLAGKKAFISYELGDVTAFPDAYSGGPERAYGEFYSAMKTWGRYDLVADPNDADVIFAVRFVDPVGVVPQIRVGIMDAKTHVALWGFVEQVDFKFRKKNRDLAFTDSVKLLVTDIQTLLGQATIPPPTPAQQ